MSIWSVDSIVKPIDQNDRHAIYRMVHFKEDVEQDSGVRYFASSPGEMELLGWGQAYNISQSVEGELKREKGTILLDGQFEVQRASDVESFLRDEIGSSLGESQSRPGQLTDEPDALPIEEASRGKDPIWARVHVHRVGQGDTIVLELPGNQLWLIDARLWGTPRRDRFQEWMSDTFNGRTSFDKVIITHLHYDHIHSIPHILDNYQVGEVLVPNSLSHPTATARRVLLLAGNRLANAAGGRTYRLGDLQIRLVQTSDLSQHQTAINSSRDPNEHEIAIVMQTSKSAAFLAGDIPADYCHSILNQEVAAQRPLRYYKVSHHGSRTGWSADFPRPFHPGYSIVSCGQGNRYGHPHQPPVQFNTMTWRDGREVYSDAIR